MTDRFENKAFYAGNSMRREFVPGDLLETREIPFGEIRVGDVVAFREPRPDAHAIVHRVIAREADCLVTMGDNNATPDAHRVTVEDNPRLVVARSPRAGVELSVARGARGRLVFRWHRVRRFARRVAGALWRRTFGSLFRGRRG